MFAIFRRSLNDNELCKTIVKVIRILIWSIVGSITYLEMIFHEFRLFAITSKLKVNVPNDIEITFYSIKDLFDVGTLFISSILHFLNNLRLWDHTRLLLWFHEKGKYFRCDVLKVYHFLMDWLKLYIFRWTLKR